MKKKHIKIPKNYFSKLNFKIKFDWLSYYKIRSRSEIELLKKKYEKKQRKKNKKGKCEHEIKYGDPCPECGYEEGMCEKCGKNVCGNNIDGYEEC